MTEALISRNEANDLIDLLMDTDGPKQLRRKPGLPGPVSRRFGRCELAELLDAIYGREELRQTTDRQEEAAIIDILERLAG
jgi:hypothetical protein